ncbi:glycosyltransferase [Paenibacillus ehimensis]|uniref:Glycosyltransferase n=1 Tax=Paenibacillus ehimensis TaxID=79264 RepID=A0ABT8V2V9_9BACL|nr:glycosyltransferase [Paenibacillus ehimensis]MDO3675758.1 glycosyltransferase [Paenibacillus ehimensis]MEC0213042.1 glycosyltransferase [Paenibacillus ehimensis]
MKILHVIANLAPRYGGPAKAIMGMTRSLAERGHQVTIFTTNQDGPGTLDVPLYEPMHKDGVEIRYFPIQQPKFWGTSFGLAKALEEHIPNYDIVHTHSLYLFHNLVSGHYCRKFGVPYIVRPHGTLDPYIYQRNRGRKRVMEWLFEHRNIKRASALHYTTEEEMILAKPYTFDSQGFVVPNGVDLSEYKTLPPKGTFRELYPELAGKKIVLFFSRLNFKKGLDILIEAFDKIKDVHPDAHLVIAGPDNENYGSKVKEWIGERHLTDKVLFTGMVTGQQKLAVLQEADLFVLPSYSENFGISVIEALICGTPVLISDKVNIWREVAAHQAGRVAPCDSDQFAKEMASLLSDLNLCEKMGELGKQFVAEYYSWNQIGVVLEEEYKKIINTTKSRMNVMEAVI